MTRLHLVALTAFTLLGCSNKPGPTIIDTPDPEPCSTANDCGGGERCVAGECVPPDAGSTDPDGGPGLDAGTGPDDGGVVDTGAPEDAGVDPDVALPPAECEDPGEPRRFVRWSDSALDLVGDDGPEMAAGNGIAIEDFDGDGLVDVVTTAVDAQPRLFVNQGGGDFVDATAGSGLETVTGARFVLFADFDGDGDSDLYMGYPAEQFLLLNDGSGQFSDVTDGWGIERTFPGLIGAAAVDFDGDGDLDIYAWAWTDGVNLTNPNALFRNDGDGFTEVSPSPGGAAAAGATNAATWWDYDGDGDPDLLVGNDFGPFATGDQLYRNDGPAADPDGWAFTDVSAPTGFDTNIFTMSTTVADFDNDLDLDVYMANIGYNVLHVVDGTMATDEAVQRGVGVGHLADPMPRPATDPDYDQGRDEPGMDEFLDAYTDPSLNQYALTSWASIFFDADHDGWLDLWVVNGMVVELSVPEASNQPNYLYHSLQDGTFEQAPCWYRPDIRGSSRSSAVGDLDGDGDLDILFVETGMNASDPGLYVLRNDDGEGNWLIVELEGTAPNTDAIGARVTITVGSDRQMRHIDGGQGFVGVSERIAHFGVADAGTIDAIEVEWPDGTTTMRTDVDVNQRLVITQ